ncbi:XdhC family protein [Robertkochia aurantiaca]|uniref:XdhC family protein n=1 Tax=Robertkochia aurantiaca TaxID=2873700 RepID=UPI001CCC515D|nr:XdhC/CoxI family protein [Robertkochia sp. 3YJGBD-33]
MTHEFKEIIDAFEKAQDSGKAAVLVTVVALDGSSYRRPGVRMLITEDGNMTGAVSGGCVEKEILRRSQSVFMNSQAKLITYDGRYRLGCEGILYILIEPFDPGREQLNLIKEDMGSRKPLKIMTYFLREEGNQEAAGSVICTTAKTFSADQKRIPDSSKSQEVFEQELQPLFRLVLIGAEHDVVILSRMADLCGWQVVVVAPLDDARKPENFPGATTVVNTEASQFDLSLCDEQTAIVLMNHSYVKDLQYLMRLQNSSFAYLGLLGPSRRREQLFQELIEKAPETDPDFLERIHGPAGIDIGAEAASEISVSIIAEILSVVREQTLKPLREKKGRIHSGIKL